jgi:amidase
MERRQFLRNGLIASAAALAGTRLPGGAAAQPAARAVPEFELEEATVAQLQQGMESGRWTARALTEEYLRRIEQIDRHGPELRSILETNPDALAIADELDRERRARGARGPLHGIPVLLKDNIDTADRMTTTAGSLALEGSIAAQDSGVAQRLRAAGAVLLAKTNLSEWANIRSEHSSSGWSGRGGQCRNPYALDRNPCGSSSGSGAAASANLGAVAIGTETDGSIVCPSNACGLVGLKPTVGLVSRAGIIPISHTQDTAGPMTRTVADAAVLLGALAGVDPRDPQTSAGQDRLHADYTRFLDPNGLRGARLGVGRMFAGFHPEVDRVFDAALEDLKKLGAELVDPVKLPDGNAYGENELTVLLYEFKADLNKYLESLGSGARVKSLEEIIRFNEENRDREMPHFGQELFIKAQAKGPLTTREYRTAKQHNLRLLRERGIDAVLRKHRLDAIVAPTGGPAWTTDLVNGDHYGGGSSSPAAVAGYPDITLPAGDVRGLPVGISFFAGAWSEPVLLRLAYAYEQATRHRRAPRFLATLES